MENLLQNKYILYFILFIAVTNILGYLAIQDFDSLAVFIAFAILTSYFSKNMIIILGIALLGTNIIYANNKIREGLENKKKKKKSKKGGKNNDDDDDNETDSEDNTDTDSGDESDDEEEGFTIDDNTEKVPRIDRQATMDKAYANLNQMLGKGGMQNLTKDTQKLMGQQEDLMKQLKDFSPLMEQAGEMLEKLGGMDNLQGLVGKLGNISGLTGGKKK